MHKLLIWDPESPDLPPAPSPGHDPSPLWCPLRIHRAPRSLQAGILTLLFHPVLILDPLSQDASLDSGRLKDTCSWALFSRPHPASYWGFHTRGAMLGGTQEKREEGPGRELSAHSSPQEPLAPSGSAQDPWPYLLGAPSSLVLSWRSDCGNTCSPVAMTAGALATTREPRVSSRNLLWSKQKILLMNVKFSGKTGRFS